MVTTIALTMTDNPHELALAATAATIATDDTRPSSPETTTRARAWVRGELMGRYVVLFELGVGGMGVVLAAYDPELDRKVALKLLKPRSGELGGARERLQREAQALAKLNHHNVVSVHDVGIHDGQLFVAMEFVAGQTLGQWMAAVESPRPWPEVLAVFMAAGRGLAAAHEAGLVHRDFKPHNVMHGEDGRVRVMDFGLARDDHHGERGGGDQQLEGGPDPSEARERAPLNRLTQTGAMLGTPAYMSLEQFEGREVDARSDQFSFCVALYEALYGQRPFAATTLADLLVAIERGQVRQAPKGAAVPARLRQALRRGLAATPQERWPSMQALLEALADDPTPRRRRWATALAVTLLAGGAWTIARSQQADAQFCQGAELKLAGAWDEERRAHVKEALLGSELSYAPGTWARVETQLDAYAKDWVTARVEACEATHHGEQSGVLLDLRMACLDERRLHLRATVDELARADAKVVENAVKAVQTLPRLERCADLGALMAEVPPPEDPAVAERITVLSEQLVETRAKREAGRYDEGLAQARSVIAEAKTLGYEPLMARAWLLQGMLQAKKADYEAALTTLSSALDAALAQRMVTEAARASTELVYVVGYRQAQHEEGRRWAFFADALSRASTDEARALYLNSVAAVAFSEGKYEEARGHYEHALTLRKQALGPDHPDVASSLNNLGSVASRGGWYDQALDYHERALALTQRVLGPDHPDVASSLTNLGNLMRYEGKYAEARDYHERALAVWEQALGTDHPLVAGALNNLGVAATYEGEYEEARGYHERALTIREQALGLDHPDVAGSLSSLGGVANAEGKYAEARDYHERALAIQSKTLRPDHPRIAGSLANLGEIASLEGKHQEARGYHERALAIVEPALGPDHPFVASVLTVLGEALLGLAEPAEALPLLERALAIRDAKRGDPVELARTHFALARALREASPDQDGEGPRARALELARLALGGYAEAGPSAIKARAQVETWLAERRE